MVSSRGHKLQFWSKIVAAYPDNLVQDLIAHELTHVDQWASGWDEDDDNFWVEYDADETMTEWGFDAYAMDEWDQEHGVTKVLDIDLNTAKGKRALKDWKKRSARSGR